MNLGEQFTEKEIKVINRFRKQRRIEKYAFTFCSLLFVFIGIFCIGTAGYIIHKAEIDNLYEAIEKPLNPNELYPGYYFTLRYCLILFAVCFLIALIIYNGSRLTVRETLLLKCLNIIESDQNEKVDDTC